MSALRITPPMSPRRRFFLVLGLAGLALLALALRSYSAAAAAHTDDPASVIAASRAAMRFLPLVAFGIVLLAAAAMGWWRDRAG